MVKFIIGFVLGGVIITFYPEFLPSVKDSVCQMLQHV